MARADTGRAADRSRAVQRGWRNRREFWRWGFSDLQTNIVRGILAEFLVAQAVGAREPVRIAWDDFDVASAAGTHIEVKSSASKARVPWE